MLPKACRIRLNRDFERIFNYRRSVSGRFVRLVWARPSDTKQALSRVAVVVSTKVSKKAVVRNRLRRRAQAVLTGLFSYLQPPLDIVIVCQPGAAASNSADFQADVRMVLSKVFDVSL